MSPRGCCGRAGQPLGFKEEPSVVVTAIYLFVVVFSTLLTGACWRRPLIPGGCMLFRSGVSVLFAAEFETVSPCAAAEGGEGPPLSVLKTSEGLARPGSTRPGGGLAGKGSGRREAPTVRGSSPVCRVDRTRHRARSPGHRPGSSALAGVRVAEGPPGAAF